MQNTEKRQTAKVGGSGSFFNQLMSNNSTIPIVGKGATQMHFSDRTCFEVVEVSKDGKIVKLQHLRAQPETAGSQIGHQDWIFEELDRFTTIKWRYNAWRKKVEEIVYTDSFLELIKNNSVKFEDYEDEIYNENGDKIVVEGKTELKVEWHKINILFGVKDYHYDWTR